MQARFLATPVVLAAVLAAACSDSSPTSLPDASAPNLHHRPGHGGGGGDDEGGKPNFGPAITVEFLERGGDNITSDGRGIYVDRECGVSATFNLNDARLDPDANKIGRKDATACGGRDARKVKVAFTDRVEGSPLAGQDRNTVGANFFKVNEVEFVTASAESPALRTAVIHGAGCAHGLIFNSLHSTGQFTVNDVLVTRVAENEWRVESEDPHVAVCIPDEEKAQAGPRSYYYMPFEITVRLK